MKSIIFLILEITLLINFTSGAVFQCKRKDPKLNECLLKEIKKLIPEFPVAHPKYGIPVLDPHHLTDVAITQGNKQIGLNFSMTNVQFHGLKNINLYYIDLDTKNRKLKLRYKNKRFVSLSDYEARGKILLFPINGGGKGNITTTDVEVTVSMVYDFVTSPETNKKQVSVKNIKYNVTPGKGYFDLENLFKGDKYLSDQINNVINENQKELIPTFLPSIEAGLEQSWTNLANDFFSIVPYDDIFIK